MEDELDQLLAEIDAVYGDILDYDDILDDILDDTAIGEMIGERKW